MREDTNDRGVERNRISEEELEAKTVDYAEMILSGLEKKLPLNKKYVEEIRQERNNNIPVGNTEIGIASLYGTGNASSKEVVKTAADKRPQSKLTADKNVSTEYIMTKLYEIYDQMIEMFEKVGIDSEISGDIVKVVKTTTDSIRHLGGKVEEFDPFNHVSGLEAPNFHENAKKVIDTTIKCYRIGSITDANIDKSGKVIKLTFNGKYKEDEYRVLGTVKAPEWSGNEAIDYIYSIDGGRMSVKVYVNGKWVDKSNDGYVINWEFDDSEIEQPKELFAKNKGETNINVEMVNNENKKNEINCSTIKENENFLHNNIENSKSLGCKKEDPDEEIGDFAIDER